MDLKKVGIRAASGIVYILIIVALIYCGAWGVWFMAAVLAAMATLEFDKISYYPDRKRTGVIICDVVANVALALTPSWAFLVAAPIWVIANFTRFIMELYAKEENPLRSLSTSVMAQVYIGLPMATLAGTATYLHFVFGTRAIAHGVTFSTMNECTPILLMFILIWINDTGAFLVGSLAGRHKMFERISPKKTWEGLAGGVLFNILGCVLLYLCNAQGYFHLPFGMATCVIYGVLVSLFATWGDLIESLIKRNLGLKDSGNIMPGHGGILDRIDSLLFVVPMSACFVLLVALFGSYMF